VISEFQGSYRFLSNFYDQPVFYQHPYMQGAIWWPTAEHAFQASKTQLPSEVKSVLQASTPGEAKRLGRRLTLRDDWEQMRKRVMFSVLVSKFAPAAYMQDGSLGAQLVATVGQTLVEGNAWNDRYWGACTAAWSPDGIPLWTPDSGRELWGHNYLGRLLMAVRDILE
jgi:ribA/ribD-fused uncharacterized protein